MRALGEWAGRLVAAQPRQPDPRSCGASALVVERALRDEGYAQLLAEGGEQFRAEVFGMHRRVTGLVGPAGRLQLPWPRALGTPPWAVVSQLSSPGRPWVARWAWRRASLLDAVVVAVASGAAVPLYVGSRWLPRHVVLVVDADENGLRCYEPSRGRVQTVSRRAFLDAALGLAGWSRPWCAVLPSRPR